MFQNYECYVEKEARRGVQNCQEGDSDRELGGENSLWVPISEAAKQWWSTVALADPTDLTITPRWLTPPLRSFTLMGYGYTDKIGCAVQKCNDKYFVKCRYKPGYFELGWKLYKTGKPCDACDTCENVLCVE
ncbi:unnamed protein product [Strongylus vulgaris]|uniref:Uncharacterized protein n=1 Tax=Strongylus vulgaris TaxID=40348 RepID=A0A3P7K4Z6_STRVU|nr:unnamed protein product [Strongylus vulgaris]